MVCPPYTGICLFFVRWSSTFRGHRGASRKLPLCAMSLAQLEVWPWHRTFEATQETWNQFCCLPCDCQRRRKTDDRLWPIWPKVFFCGFIILSAKDVFFLKPTNILHASHFIIKNTCNLGLFNLLRKKKMQTITKSFGWEYFSSHVISCSLVNFCFAGKINNLMGHVLWICYLIDCENGFVYKEAGWSTNNPDFN